MTSKEGSMLPRELIVWLQSLHLSHHIKHPKRDLSNGFIIAQICHYYWGSNVISLHSFTNGCGLANKQSNWSVLRKAFAKQNIPLSEEMINGMISCKDRYAECFLCQLYTILTGKELKQQQQQSQEELKTENKELLEKCKVQDKCQKTSTNAIQTGATQIKGSNDNYGTENKIQVYDQLDNANDKNNLRNNSNETLKEMELKQEIATLETHSTAVEYISRVISLTLQREFEDFDNVNAYSKTEDDDIGEKWDVIFVTLLKETANFYNKDVNDNNNGVNYSDSKECNKYKCMQFISHFVQCAERQQAHEYSGAVDHKTWNNENRPYSAVMDAVWSALHARLPLILEHYIAQNEMNVIDVIETFLCVPKGTCAKTQMVDHDLGTIAPLTVCDRSFTFIHALLSLWSDSNPHACFNFCVQHLLTLPSLLYVIKYNTNYNIAHNVSFILCAMLSSRSLTLANRQIEQMCKMIKQYIFNVHKYYYTKHEENINNDNNIVSTNVMIDLSEIHYDNNNVNAAKNGYTQEDKTHAYLLIMQTLFVQVVKRYDLSSNMSNTNKWCYNNYNDHNGGSSKVYSGQMKTRSPLVNRASVTSVEGISDLKEQLNVLTNKEKYKYNNNKASNYYQVQSGQMLHFFVENLFSLVEECVRSENAELELLATSVAVSLIKHASSVLSLSFIKTSLLTLFFSDKCFSIDVQNENQEVINTNPITWIDVMKVMLARRLWQRFARFDCLTKVNSKQYNTNTDDNNNEYIQYDKDEVLELQYSRNVLLHVLHEYSCRLLWSCSTMNETQESTQMLKLHNALAYELAISLNYLPEESPTTITSIADGDGSKELRSLQNKESSANIEKSTDKNDLERYAYRVALFIAQSLLHYYKANKTLDALLTNVNNINSSADNSNNEYHEEKCIQEIENEANRENELYISTNKECNLLPPVVRQCNVFSYTSSLLFTKALFGLYPNYFSTITELVKTADEMILQNMVQSVINNETSKTSSNKTDKTNNVKGAMTRDVHTVTNKIKQRLTNRVSALSRQKNVSVDVEVRICWLYVIIISAASSSSSSHKENKLQTDLSYEAFHTLLPTLRERKALRRKWNVLLQLSYDDIALITMAAELAARQLHNRVNAKNEESTSKLLQLAAQAQQVVCYWYTTLSLPDEINSNTTYNTQDEEKEVESTVVRAMKWYHEVFGRETN